MPQNCYPVTSGGANCVQCDGQIAVTAVPEVVTTNPNPGWNASAVSSTRLDGSCYTEFTVPDGVTGVMCGLSSNRVNDDPRNIQFGIYVYQQAGRSLWYVAELGVNMTAPVPRVPATDLFRIERARGVVTYFFNGRRYYVSSVPSVDSLVVVACMYLAGDGVD